VEWSWVNRPWTSNDSPYTHMKRRIDTEFKDNKRIESVTKKYRHAAKAKPKDALAQYAWGYAAYAGRPVGFHIDRRELPNIAISLGDPKAPDSYEYNRLRFVVTVRWRPYSQLKPLGLRLLQRNANDFDVKRGVINLLVAGSKAEQQQALKYAQELVNVYPDRSSSYSSLGWVYDIKFAREKDPAIGDKAIAAYRKCIALSKNPVTRQSVEHSIKVIQQEQAELKAKKGH
jgi:tetratricopeptide (TPR) repeat protein